MREIYVLARNGDVAGIAAKSDAVLTDPLSQFYINSTDAEQGESPIFFAAYNGHIETVKLLLERGANLFIASIEGLTVLHLVIWKLTNRKLSETETEKLFSIVDLLLRKDPGLLQTKDSNGYTPLDYADMKPEVKTKFAGIISSLHIAENSAIRPGIFSRLFSIFRRSTSPSGKREAIAIKAIDALMTGLRENNQTLIEQQITILEQIGLQRSVAHPSMVLTELFDKVVGSVSLGSVHPYVLLRILKIVHLYAELTFSHQQYEQERHGAYLFERDKTDDWKEKLGAVRKVIKGDSYNVVLLFELKCITTCINLLDKKIGVFSGIKESLVAIANACLGNIDVGPVVHLIIGLCKDYCRGTQWYGSVLALRNICAMMLKQQPKDIKAFFDYLSSTSESKDRDGVVPMKTWQFRCCIVDMLAMLVTEAKDPATKGLAFELLGTYGSIFKCHAIAEVNEDTNKVMLEYITALFKVYRSSEGEINVRTSKLLAELSLDLGELQIKLKEGRYRSLKYIEIARAWYGVMNRGLYQVSQTSPQVSPVGQSSQALISAPLQLAVTALKNISLLRVDGGTDAEIHASISLFEYKRDMDEEKLMRIMKIQQETAKVLMEGRNVEIVAAQSPDGTFTVTGGGTVRIRAAAVMTIVESVPRVRAGEAASASTLRVVPPDLEVPSSPIAEIPVGSSVRTASAAEVSRKACEQPITIQCNIHPGLQYQPILGDGNCLYRAVSCYLGHGEDVSFLRSMVAANLEYNKAQYAGFIPLRDGQSIQDYIVEVRNTRTWATEVEINILMKLLNRPIVIIGPDGIIRNKEAVNQYSEKEPIFVFYNGGDERSSSKPGHYDVLLLRDGYDSRTVLSEMLNFAYKPEVTQVLRQPQISSSQSVPCTQVERGSFPTGTGVFAGGAAASVPQSQHSVGGGSHTVTGVAGAVSAAQGAKVDVRSAETMINVEHQSVVNNFGSGCSDSRLSDERLAELKQRLNAYCASKAVVTRLLSNREFKVEEIYINLLLIKERQAKEKERALKQAEQVGDAAVRHLCYEQIRGEKESIDIERIFDSTERGTEPNRRVVIFGCAGSGKTTLCKYIVKRWMGQKEQGSRLAPLWADKFEWVFWIPLRNVVAGEYTRLLDAIYCICFGGAASGFSETDIQRFWDQIDKSKVLLLLDGFDEVAGCYYPKKDNSPLTQLLSDAFAGSIILTSRPYTVESNLPSFKHHLEVTGFTIENVSHYVENFFPGNSVLAKDLIAFLGSNPTLRNLAQIPINLELLCDIWESATPSKDMQVQLAQFTVTEIYEKIVEYLMRRYLEKFSFEYKDRKADTKNLKKNRLEALLKLEIQFTESLAFKMEIGGKLILQGREIDEDEELCAILNEKNLFPMLSDLGFLKGAELGERTDGSDIAKEYYFLHLTLQEFFTARFIARWIKDSCTKEDAVQATQAPIAIVLINGRNYTIQEFIAEYKYNPRYEIVWGFVAGLLRKDCRRELNFFFDCLLGEPRDLVGLYSSLLHIRCLEECLPQPSPNEFLVCIVNQLRNLLLHWVNEPISEGHPLYLDHFDLVLKQLRLSPRTKNWVAAGLGEFIFRIVKIFKEQVCRSTDCVLRKVVKIVSQEQVEVITKELLLLLKNKDQSSDMRRSIVDVFGEVVKVLSQEQAGVITKELLLLLKGTDQSEDMRFCTVRVLEEVIKVASQELVGVRAIIDELLPLLKDTNQSEYVRSSIVDVFGEVVKVVSQEQAGVIVNELLLLLKDKDQSEYVRPSIVRVFNGALGVVSQEQVGVIVNGLLLLLKDKDQSEYVRSSVVRVFEGALGVVSQEQVGVIVNGLLLSLKGVDRSGDVRFSTVIADTFREVVEVIKVVSREQAREIVNGLLPLLKDTDQSKYVRSSIVRVLREVVKVVSREQAGVIVEELLPLLKDKDQSDCVRFSIVDVLGEVVKVLSQEQAGVITKELLLLLKGTDKRGDVGRSIVRVLGEVAKIVSQELAGVIVDGLLPLIKDKDQSEDVRFSIVRVFDELGKVVSQEQVGVIIDELLPLLKDKDQSEDVRFSIVRVFWAVVKVVSQEQARVIVNELLLLLKYTYRGRDVTYPIVSALKEFVKVVSQEQAGVIVNELLLLLKDTDQDRGVRSSIVDVFGEVVKVVFREQAGVIVEELLLLLKDTDQDRGVRSSIVNVFGEVVKVMSQEQAGVIVEELLPLLKDKDQSEDVRSSIVNVFREVVKVMSQEQAGVIVNELLSLLKDKDQSGGVRFSIASVLREVGKVVSQEQAGVIVKELLPLLKDTRQSGNVRFSAANALGRVIKVVSQEQAGVIVNGLLLLLKDTGQSKYKYMKHPIVNILREVVKVVSQEQAGVIVNGLLPLLKDTDQRECVRSSIFDVFREVVRVVSREQAEVIVNELLLLLLLLLEDTDQSKHKYMKHPIVNIFGKVAKVVSQEQAGVLVNELLRLLKDTDQSRDVGFFTFLDGAFMRFVEVVSQEAEGVIIKELLPWLSCYSDNNMRSFAIRVLNKLGKRLSSDIKDILNMGVGTWGSTMTYLLWLERRALFFASDPQCSGGVMVCWIDSSNEIKKVAVPKEEVQNLRLGIETAMRDVLGMSLSLQEAITPRSAVSRFFSAPTGVPPSPSASILSPQRDGDQDLPESQETRTSSWCCIQ